MAVYTDVSDEELTAFVAQYAIGDVLSAKGIAEGVENSNFLLHTTEGFFILTLYEKRVREDDLPFFIGLMEHLARKGLIVTFLDGMGVKRATAAHCSAVGAALAKLHQAGTDYPVKRENALSVSGWRPLFEQARERADTVMPGLAQAISEALQDLEQHWPTHLPRGVIHADLFPDNVFFIGSQLSGLIDFYFACNDDFAYDLAIGLNAWCFEIDGSFNLTKGQAMISGYQRERVLQAEEIAALPILCRGSALRFMLTRLVDWLNVPPGALVRPKDPLEYYKKLRFHLRATSAADYGFSQ